MDEKEYQDRLQKIIFKDKLSHAYLIDLDESEENQQKLHEFIKEILTKGLADEQKIEIIKELDENKCADLKIIEPEKRMIKKEKLIELQADFKSKSLNNGNRVYVIKNVEYLNDASGNSLLKFIEEPEENIYAILTTNNRYRVLPTIVSRCQYIAFRKEEESEALSSKVATFTELILYNKSDFFSQSYIQEFVMEDKDQALDVLRKTEKVLFGMYRNNLLNAKPSYDEEHNSRLLKYISIIEKSMDKLDSNINYKLWLDCFILDIMEV